MFRRQWELSARRQGTKETPWFKRKDVICSLSKQNGGSKYFRLLFFIHWTKWRNLAHFFPRKKISLKKTIWPCVCSLLHKHSDFTSCQSCSLKTKLHCHKNPPGHFHHSDDSLLFFPPTQWPGFQDNSQWWEEGPHAQEDFRKHEGRFLMLFILLIDEWLQRGFSNLDDRSSGVWLSVTVRTFPVWMIVFLALCFLFSA